MIPPGERVLVEAAALADNGVNAVTVQLRGPTGQALPPLLVARSTVRIAGPGLVLVEGAVVQHASPIFVIIEFRTPAAQAHPPLAILARTVHPVETGGGDGS